MKSFHRLKDCEDNPSNHCGPYRRVNSFWESCNFCPQAGYWRVS